MIDYTHFEPIEIDEDPFRSKFSGAGYVLEKQTFCEKRVSPEY